MNTAGDAWVAVNSCAAAVAIRPVCGAAVVCANADPSVMNVELSAECCTVTVTSVPVKAVT